MSKSSEYEHVEQVFDDSHTGENPTATPPHLDDDIYDSIEEILKDVSLGLNNIPLGLLRSEDLSQWAFNNPSRDTPTRPELFLQQEDFSEEERANRIMNWLDKRFPRTRTGQPFVSDNEREISDREERNGTSSTPETNPRWFYTEIDFNAWLVEEDRPGQGSHARGSFVKKGGDWRCVRAQEAKPLRQHIC